ncbi:hypothetical protein HORIV_59660 [Vreelandella olivaria]|uniref:Uncharacterized protein n=1 Tax=Vreelandella olivaria TaxID=390919 RepID=A0ABM7GS59_9GAMM|nr:hypothetical protein HORIV_59660 [Halomonas olivaria]
MTRRILLLERHASLPGNKVVLSKRHRTRPVTSNWPLSLAMVWLMARLQWWVSEVSPPFESALLVGYDGLLLLTEPLDTQAHALAGF